MKERQIPSKFLDSIFLGDCRELLKELPNNSVDLVISSPPYNIGKSYEKKRALDVYLAEQAEVLRSCCRVLKPTGSIFWQIGSYVDTGVHIPLDIKVFPILESLGMVPRNRIIWLRTHGLHAKNRFSCRHETLLWFTKGEQYKYFLDPIRVPQKYPDKTSWRGRNKGDFTSHPLGKNPGDVWAFRNVKHNHEEETIHPCQFPEDLVERVVLASSGPGDVVLDPYMGAGTVAVVAHELHRHFVGAEIDPEYHAVALHRLSGNPDSKANFPNLKTLRQYAERHEIKDLSRFSFTRQVGKIPSDSTRARIFPEDVHLEVFEETTKMESENSAFKRQLVDHKGRAKELPKRMRSKQLSIWGDKS